MQTKPTLLIGAGGTGTRVLATIKARMLRDYGDLPETVRILSFDVDRGATYNLDESEFKYIGGVKAGEVFRDKDSFPYIKNWLKEEKVFFSPGGEVIDEGAQQERQLGRLCLFWHIDETTIWRDMIDVVDSIRLFGGSWTKDEVTESNERINVFIVSSLCGGTGSGIFLDLAYIIRSILKNQGVDRFAIQGVFVLPKAFRDIRAVKDEDIAPNAYAALLELDRCMAITPSNPLPPIRYGDEHTVERMERPFALCYLVDAQREDEKVLGGLDETVAVIANSIFLHLSRSGSEQKKTQVVNIASDKTGFKQSAVGNSFDTAFNNIAPKMRYPFVYSILGTYTLAFPADAIMQLCGYKLGSQMIKEWVIADGNPESLKSQGQSFWDSLWGGSDDNGGKLLEAMSLGVDGKPIRVDLRGFGRGFQGTKNSKQALGTFDAQVNAYKGTEIPIRLQNELKTKRKEIESLLQSKLLEKTLAILNDQTSKGRLAYASEFLNQLVVKLDNVNDNLSDRQNQIDLDKLAQSSQSQKIEIQSASSLTFWNRSSASTFQGYVGAIQAELEGELGIRRCQESRSIVSSFKDYVQNVKNGIDAWCRAANALLDNLQKDEEAFIVNAQRQRSFVAENITTQNVQSEIYDKSASKAYISATSKMDWELDEKELFRLKCVIDHDGNDRMTYFTSGSILTGKDRLALASFFKSHFDEVNQIKIEDQLLSNSKEDGEKKAILSDLVSNLQAKSRALCLFDSYRLGKIKGGQKIRQLLLLGTELVPPEGNSVFEQIEMPMTLASTYNKHEIVCLTTKHGYPLSALQQLPNLQHVYNAMRDTRALHVFPESELSEASRSGRTKKKGRSRTNVKK